MSSITGRSIVHALPPAAGAELTNFCNLRCPECNSGSGLMTRERGFMRMPLVEKLIDELGPFLFNMNLFFQGEPMMHPLIFQILEKCRKIHTTISTNGHFIDKEIAEKLVRSGLGELIISLDGMSEMTYSAYRVNGDFKTVISGIRSVSEALERSPSKLKLTIQFLVSRHNEHEIPELRKFALRIKASVRLKSMQVINRDAFELWLPAEHKFSRYKKSDAGYKIKSRLPDRCARLWFNPVITWDGMVIPCCFDKNGDHVMGDLNKSSFRDIWYGSEYQKFRNRVLQGRREIEICTNCTSGMM